MNLKTFKKIYNQIAQLEKNDIQFDISIKGDADYQEGSESAYFEPVHYQVKTLKQLSDVQTILARPIKLDDQYNKVTITDLDPNPCVKGVSDIFLEMQKRPGERQKYPTLKFWSETARGYMNYVFDVNMISSAPTEQIEEEKTYRYIGNKTRCLFCIPHDHPLYNYLDTGFFFMNISVNGKEKVIITNELTMDTYLVFALLTMQPAYYKQLQHECFVNAAHAKLLRVKFEKDFKGYKAQYDRVRELAIKENEKFLNSNILSKLAEGKVSHAVYNHIKLEKTKATYETITIEADDLFNVIQNEILLDDRTDIYVIIRGYINYVINSLEKEELATTAEDIDPVTGALIPAVHQNVEHTFRINGITIRLKRTSENTRRYVNDVPINKAEVEHVAFRASCFTKQDEFEKFINAVHVMSLKWHDVLANGLAVKIHDKLSADEYNNALAPTAAPRIKFRYEDKTFKLIINDEKSVKIKFNDVIKKVALLNRKINNRYVSGYNARDYRWGRVELIKVLKECCTFEKTTKVLGEDGKQIIDEVVNQQKDENGNVLLVNGQPVTTISITPRVETTSTCTLSDEDAKFVETMSIEFQKKAIEKSKIFLETALQRTGAELIQFNGEEGYKVKGMLRSYVVNKKTNQVFNFENKRHICIVEPGHQVSVGFDALAARLYALKNDKFMTAQIGTLSHG